MSDTNAQPPAAEVEIREWRALQETYAKAAEKHSKDLPDDAKVKASVGDLLRARVIKRNADTIIIADGILNGAPLPENIRVIQKFHWSRVAEAPEVEAAAAPEPEPEIVAVPEPEPEPEPELLAAAEPEVPATEPELVVAPPPPAAPSARRLRAWFLQKRGGPKSS